MDKCTGVLYSAIFSMAPSAWFRCICTECHDHEDCLLRLAESMHRVLCFGSDCEFLYRMYNFLCLVVFTCVVDNFPALLQYMYLPVLFYVIVIVIVPTMASSISLTLMYPLRRYHDCIHFGLCFHNLDPSSPSLRLSSARCNCSVCKVELCVPTNFAGTV